MSLRDLVNDPASPIDAIGAYLDGLSPEERLTETRTLNRDEQRALYGKAAAHRPLTLDDFVPPGTAQGVQIIHDGRNTLPLPGGWKLFQKRFCQAHDGSARRFGYNESPFVNTIGPGFYVAVPTAGNAEWERRGRGGGSRRAACRR